MNIKQRRLPSAYQEVEYIQSAGGGELINTGIYSYDIDKIETEIAPLTFSSYGWLFGNYIDEDHDCVRVIYQSSQNGRIYVSFNSKAGASLTVVNAYTIGTFNKWTIYNDGSVIGSLVNDVPNETRAVIHGTENATNIVLFGGSTTRRGFIAIKIKYWRAYKNNVLVRNMIPCYRVSDSVIGMYDTVNGTFYTNQGTGSFTKGADVVTVDSITIPQGDVAVIRQGNQKIWQRLPWEYQEVEWIGGNYDGQTILPVHTSDTSIQSMIFEADVLFDARGSGERAIGFGTTGAVELYISSGGVFAYWVSGASRLAQVSSITTNEFVHLKLEDKPSGGLFQVGSYTASFNSALASLSSYKGVQLFGYSTSSYLTMAKMKEARLTVDGQSYHLVPCYRKSDNVVGMYDLVNGIFHTNRLTGNFIKGGDYGIEYGGIKCMYDNAYYPVEHGYIYNYSSNEDAFIAEPVDALDNSTKSITVGYTNSIDIGFNCCLRVWNNIHTWDVTWWNCRATRSFEDSRRYLVPTISKANASYFYIYDNTNQRYLLKGDAVV